jgi:hypothetical protein
VAPIGASVELATAAVRNSTDPRGAWITRQAKRLVVDRNDTAGARGETRNRMSETREAPAVMRIVLELSSEDGTVCGTLTTSQQSRSFWGWLELMSALELATGAGPGTETTELTDRGEVTRK